MFSISRINLTRSSYVARAILMPGARPRRAELPRNITRRAYGHSPSSQREVAGCNGNFAPAPRYIKIPRNPRSHCFTLIHETGTCQAHCNRIVFAFLATYSCAKILNHVRNNAVSSLLREEHSIPWTYTMFRTSVGCAGCFNVETSQQNYLIITQIAVKFYENCKNCGEKLYY